MLLLISIAVNCLHKSICFRSLFAIYLGFVDLFYMKLLLFNTHVFEEIFQSDIKVFLKRVRRDLLY